MVSDLVVMKVRLYQFFTCGFIFLLTHTALSKWLDIELFKYELFNQPFPKWFSRFMLWFLPFFEMILAIVLLWRRFHVIALYLLFFLFISFSVYAGLVLGGTFHRIPCSCGGFISGLTWEQHLIFTMLVSLIILWMIRYQKIFMHETGEAEKPQ